MPKPAADTGHGRRLLSIAVATIACASIAAALLPIRHAPELPVPVHEAACRLRRRRRPTPVSVSPPLGVEQVELRRGDTLLDILRARRDRRDGGARGGRQRCAVSTNLRRLQVGQRAAGLALDPDGGAGGDADAPGAAARCRRPKSTSSEAKTASFAAEQRRPASCGIETVAVAGNDRRSSFYAAGLEAGLPPATLAQMIKLFSWDVDFQRDLQPGDRLEASIGGRSRTRPASSPARANSTSWAWRRGRARPSKPIATEPRTAR